MSALSVVTRATWDGCRVPTPDERRAHWATKFFAHGHHRTTPKPRVRVAPITTTRADDLACEQDAPDEPIANYRDIRGE